MREEGRLRTSRDMSWLAGPWLGGAYLVRAMTLFFLGCWLTGLPMLPFFREPFRASSRCFSAGGRGNGAVSCLQGCAAFPLRTARAGPMVKPLASLRTEARINSRPCCLKETVLCSAQPEADSEGGQEEADPSSRNCTPKWGS